MCVNSHQLHNNQIQPNIIRPDIQPHHHQTHCIPDNIWSMQVFKTSSVSTKPKFIYTKTASSFSRAFPVKCLVKWAFNLRAVCVEIKFNTVFIQKRVIYIWFYDNFQLRMVNIHQLPTINTPHQPQLFNNKQLNDMQKSIHQLYPSNNRKTIIRPEWMWSKQMTNSASGIGEIFARTTTKKRNRCKTPPIYKPHRRHKRWF